MRTCPVAAGNTELKLMLKNDIFEFLRYSGYIYRRGAGQKLTSNFFRILCNKNYSIGSFSAELFGKL